MDPVVENQFEDAEEFDPVQLIRNGEAKAKEELVAQNEPPPNPNTDQKHRDCVSVISTDTFAPEDKSRNSAHEAMKREKTPLVSLGNSSVSDDSTDGEDEMSDQGSGPSIPFIIPDGVTRDDVLCGRGKGANNFIGNRQFRDLVMHYREDYARSPRRVDKRNICLVIIATVHSRGGRFLVKTSGRGTGSCAEWTVLPIDKILVKVSQALREGVGKWNKATQKFNETKARQVASRSTTPAMSLLAEISSIRTAVSLENH